MFEKASEMKLRFESARGNLTTEDLWDLPLQSVNGQICLDSIAMALNRKLKESKEESFVIKKSKKDKLVELKLNIVKRVIRRKLDAIEENEAAAIKKSRKDKLLEILSRKKDAELEELSVKDLEKMIDDI